MLAARKLLLTLSWCVLALSSYNYI